MAPQLAPGSPGRTPRGVAGGWRGGEENPTPPRSLEALIQLVAPEAPSEIPRPDVGLEAGPSAFNSTSPRPRLGIRRGPGAAPGSPRHLDVVAGPDSGARRPESPRPMVAGPADLRRRRSSSSSDEGLGDTSS